MEEPLTLSVRLAVLDKEVVVTGIVVLEKGLPCELATLGITG